MQTAINKLRERRRDGEEGFTLIELMVVVLIIAILLAIAIPTFLGARKRAQDRAAQSSLRNSLTSAKTIFTDSQTYVDASAANLNAAEPTILHQATASSGSKVVSVDSSAAGSWYGAVLSEGGTCFYIEESTATGTKFAKVATASPVCTGAQGRTMAGTTGTYTDKW